MRVEFNELEYEMTRLLENPPALQEMKERITNLLDMFEYLESDADVYSEIKERVRNYPFYVVTDLYSLDILLKDKLHADFLFNTVLLNANKPVSSKQEAIDWLQDFADKIRDILGDKALIPQ